MHVNAGTLDRVARITAGSLILIVALAMGGISGLTLGALALAVLATGLAGWCPFYAVCGVNTCGLHLPHRGKTAMR